MSIQKIIAKTFEDIATGLETGSFGNTPKIAVMGIGSEHGDEVLINGAIDGAKHASITYIGKANNVKLNCIYAENETDATAIMEKGLQDGSLDAAVAMHYAFPIGVSTVGRVITPAAGKSMFIATTTGTSATDRAEAMIRNTIYGIISAKACGIENPTVGILNIDGARQTERALKELASNGYGINFATSGRADGGSVLRGNDVLTASCDVLVCDSLTGNVLMKLLSSFTTGGSYESLGFGYGPGIGENYNQLVLIISRASGAPVISGAVDYAAQLVRGGWLNIAKTEFAQAKKAGLNDIINKLKAKSAPTEAIEVVAPPKEIVTAEISGIEIMDLETAVQVLWKEGIYAESGMGCTGPIVLVHPAKLDKSIEILIKGGFVSNE
jgi:hypothetical protein